MSTVWSYQNTDQVALAQAKVVSNVPGAAEKVLEFFSSTGPIRSSIAATSQSVTRFTNTVNGLNTQGQINADIYRRLKYQYANLYVATATGTITSGIGGITDGLTSAVNYASNKISETLKPVSSFMGATLYSLTNVMKDPLGSLFDLPSAIGPMLDAISPTLRSKFTGTLKNFNLQKIFEIPGQIWGSIQSFVGLVDQILAIPIQFISDIYAGFMDIMSEISDLINAAFDLMQQFLINIIDNLVPGLSDFLNQLSIFAGQIGAIASIFSGANAITGFTNNLINITGTLNGIIQSPLDFAFSFLPPSILQGLYSIQNPQQFVNQLLNQLPPEIQNVFGQISTVTGFGFNGNMGFGLQSVLQGLQGGVLASILNGFATQFSIIAPLFGTGSTPESTQQSYNNTTEPFSTAAGPTYDKGVVGGNVVQTEPNKPNSNYNNPVITGNDTGGVDENGVAQPPPGEENVEPDLPVA